MAPAACAVVLLGAVALWVVQEHAIHKYLLHSSFPWLGKRWVGDSHQAFNDHVWWRRGLRGVC
jgi:hypothetical protein